MNEKYDVVIIGAGIGGLTCGCYLAKAGLKVAIFEQHFQPGGCCTSFKRQDFIFDAGIHYLGSLRESGVLTGILNDFDLRNEIKFLRCDPTDRIVMPDKTLFIRRNTNDTKKELIANFPKEKDNINNFFKFILNDNFLSVFAKTRTMTFQQLLDIFFQDYKLKSIFSLLLGTIGLSAKRASAVVSIVIYNEFILDGGYYPQGGMQVLPNLLAKRFREYGGDLFLSKKIKQIMIKNKKVLGVQTDENYDLYSSFVVSNADAKLTFKELVRSRTPESKKIDKLLPSGTGFAVYLGLNNELNIEPKHLSSWFFSSYNIDRCYNMNNRNFVNNLEYVHCTFPSLLDHTLAPKGKSIVKALIGAGHFNEEFWNNSRDKLTSCIIHKISHFIPNIEKNIEIKETATPFTFQRYTLNQRGAFFGWRAIPSQINRNVFPCESSIENLYLSGHWTTTGMGQSGVAVVASCGKYTATKIIRSRKLMK